MVDLPFRCRAMADEWWSNVRSGYNQEDMRPYVPTAGQ